MNTGLNSYKKKAYSQWGEDGILEEIFRRIGEKHKFCVEFGAGDGYDCSNVWHLIEAKGWRALLMEPDERRWKKWAELKKGRPNLTVLKTAVTAEGDTALERILAANSAPKDLDLLSIDIDGDDHRLLESLSSYRPRVLVVEHNPTIPPEDAVVKEAGAREAFGASARANAELARKKGYRLAAATQTNCIFVIEADFGRLGIEEPELAEAFDRSGLSYVISAYNGSQYLRAPDGKGQPAYGWIYRGFRLSVPWSRIRAAAGPVFKAAASKTLAERYRTVSLLFSNKGGKKP